MADNPVFPTLSSGSGATAPGDQANDFRFGSRSSTPPPRPLGAAAFCGLAGEIVRRIAPHTEADEAALLGTNLVYYGNCVGRSPHFQIGGDRHATNLNISLVGPTASRKGSAERTIGQPYREADPYWYGRCINSGLSSGEGIIHAVRDAVWETRATRRNGETTTDEVLVDAGVEDKRLLVIQEEFAGALKAMERHGNTLSAIMRQAYDGLTLRTMTKTPMQATDPHISCIFHIGKYELNLTFGTVESANGLGNRIIWVWVKRSKSLPHGGSLNADELLSLVDRLAAVIQFGRSVGRMIRSPEANEIWESEYPRLSAERPGLYGCMVARAAPQVLRMSMIYALMDGLDFIMPEHLLAALEYWRYSDESVRFIFGGRLGDPVADRILESLRTAGIEGLTRSEISEVLQRNTQSHAIEASLQMLVDGGLATWRNEVTAGRPLQRWFAIEMDPSRPQSTA